MTDYVVGSATVEVTPSFRNFIAAVSDECEKAADAGAQIFADTFSGIARDGTSNVIGDQDADAAEKGDSAGGKFADTFKARIDAALKSLPNVQLDADSSETDRKIAEIRAELADLGRKTINVDISDDEALAKVAVLKAALADLGRSQSTSVKVDASGALSALSGSGGGIATLGEDASGAAFSIGDLLVPAIGALALALIPIGGLALGALSTLPAILAGAGSGAAALVLGFSGIVGTLTAYQATLNTAGETAAQVKTKQDALNNSFAGLTPAAQQFVGFVGSQLLPMFNYLKTATQNALLPGITGGLQALEPVFGIIGTNIQEAAKGIGQFFDFLGHVLGTQTSLYEINGIFKAGAGFMRDLANAAITVVPAILTIGQEAGPILQSIGKWIEGAAKSFSGWVANGGFQKFVEWVKANGPGIVNTLETLVGSIGKIVVALAPVGVALLKFVGWVTEAIAVVVQVIKWMGDWALLLVPMIAPIVLLGQHWSQVWNTMRDTAIAVWNFLNNNVFQPLVNFFTVSVPNAVSHFEIVIGEAWQGAHDLVNRIWGDMQKDFLNPFVDFFTTTIPNAVSGFATDVINAWNSVLGPIEHVIGAIINAYNDIPLLPNVTNPFAPKPLAVNVPNFGFPFAASGGNINGPTIVGELGPELFVPPMPGGYVVPNHQLTLPVFSGLSGGSNGPVMHVDVQNLNHDTDVVALGSQLAFLRRGQRL